MQDHFCYWDQERLIEKLRRWGVGIYGCSTREDRKENEKQPLQNSLKKSIRCWLGKVHI